eukprot:523783_1
MHYSRPWSLILSVRESEMLHKDTCLYYYKQKRNCPVLCMFNNNNYCLTNGQKAFNRIKNALKDIKKQKEMCKINLERLQLVMNETVWRKHGKLKSKKSLRERADNYAKEKEGRRKKYKRKKPDEADKAVISGAPPAKKRKQMTLCFKPI